MWLTVERRDFVGTSCVVVRLSQSRVILVGLTWYGYAHHKILCPGDGINAQRSHSNLLRTSTIPQEMETLHPW
jgi:hypothetical protein